MFMLYCFSFFFYCSRLLKNMNNLVGCRLCYSMSFFFKEYIINIRFREIRSSTRIKVLPEYSKLLVNQTLMVLTNFYCTSEKFVNYVTTR